MSDVPNHYSSVVRAPMDVRLKDVFSCDRIRTNIEVTSKRRLFEIIAKLFITGRPHAMNKDTVFRSLLERERLGSTCVGKGVMIPHSRLHGLASPLGAVVHLATPLHLEADDEVPVFLACGLLVPAECSDLHIRILARLAAGFDSRNLHQQLSQSPDEMEIFHQLMAFESDTQR